MDLYTLLIGLLFVLAVSDLIVGVSNDAVNFTNSAIGSRAASRLVILSVAALGILLGTVFSVGMMDIARTGVFNPEMFRFHDVMIIFVAVMVTDVLLLDLYNTFALPTSTTVSLVFELLGAAVAVSLAHVVAAGEPLAALGGYINSDKALAMIGAIFVSVIIAFTVGLTVQFLTRMLFTFDLARSARRYGAIWGAMAVTLIGYYILLKGMKGSVLIGPEQRAWVEANTAVVIWGSLGCWTLVFFALQRIWRVDVLRVVVLVGTFALALAFAANDLVNFIGVPFAGYAAWLAASGTPDPGAMGMAVLREPARLETWMLLLAGAIMVVTLWTSRKARAVTATEVNLSRQDSAEQPFEALGVARGMVRLFWQIAVTGRRMTPLAMRQWIQSRFRPLRPVPEADLPAFDMLRAAANLTIASSLIALGTTLKLPLSTTYVTFMVAMGTALADRAWGRDTAAERITGVMTVIGGWFITAVLAFTGAALVAGVVYLGGTVALVIVAVAALVVVVRSQRWRREG